MRRYIAPLFVIASLTLLGTTATAQEPGSVIVEEPGRANGQEPGWSGPIIATGPLREEIEATPIPYRSYRPFHFYGNTVRRMHYRGTFLPSSSDILQGGSAFLRPVRPRVGF